MIDLRHLYDEDQRAIILKAIERHKAERFYRGHRNMWDWGNSPVETFKPIVFTVPDYQKGRKYSWYQSLRFLLP